MGVPFRRPPVVSVRTRDQLRTYISRKMTEEYPPAEMNGVERTYRAFRLVPDSVDLRRLFLDLYSEQVAGFYDPDSSALFVVRGADAQMLRAVMAHELVHALQDQYARIGPILKLRRQNDRQMAGQAVFEGQAMLIGLLVMQPGVTLPDLGQMWSAIRDGIRSQQASMPVFANAPRLVQESMIFPYLAGADFIKSFDERRTRPDEQPYGDRMPVTTEQILHPTRYVMRDLPVTFTMPAPLVGDTLIFEDNFGEFETSVVLQTWGADEQAAQAAAAGWDGDRYRVFGSPAGTVIVWLSAWDSEADAADFERRVRAGFTARGSQRVQVDRSAAGGTPVVRLVAAPAAWPGWSRLPEVRLAR